MKTLVKLKSIQFKWWEWFGIFLLLYFISSYVLYAIWGQRVLTNEFILKDFMLYNYLYNAIRLSIKFLIISSACLLGSVILKFPIRFVHWYKATLGAAMIYFLKYLLKGLSIANHPDFTKEELIRWHTYNIPRLLGLNTEHLWIRTIIGNLTLYDIAFLILLATFASHFSAASIRQTSKIIALVLLPSYYLYKIVMTLIIYG